jgi:uncharacterized membrane protein
MNTNLELIAAPLVVHLNGVSILAAAIIGYVGIAIMAIGALRGAVMFIRYSFQGKNHNHLPMIRIEVGKHLALGLEFLVGKDIIESLVHQTWDDLRKLAVLIVLRTAVAFILSWELKEVKREIEVTREVEGM